MALLEIHDLHTFFKTKKGIVKAVNGVSYSVEPGKTLGVVGESGSGKSVSAMSILKLLDGNGYIDSGEIIFDGKNLADVSVKDMCKIRGNEISVIFQEPMTSLNPIFTVERQLSEPFIIHQGMNKKEDRLPESRSSFFTTPRTLMRHSSEQKLPSLALLLEHWPQDWLSLKHFQVFP